jgi:hypothetical protein
MPAQAPVSHHLDLYAYWLAKRGSRAMPARSDIEAADIPALLPYLIIAERAGDQFRYRLVGSAIVRSVGYDATGVTVGSYLADPEAAAQARVIFEGVFMNACPVFATGEFVFKTGAHLDMSLLTLPLSEDGTAVNMSISTLATCFSDIAAPQRGWLAGLPAKVFDVTDIRSTAELEAVSRKWERRCEPVTEVHPGKH